MKVKALKFTKNHGIYGNGRFSRKTANFTENVTAVKSWIRLVPKDTVLFTQQTWVHFLPSATWLIDNFRKGVEPPDLPGRQKSPT